jgi:hypothetical protein
MLHRLLKEESTVLKLLCSVLIGFQVAYVIVLANIFAIILMISSIAKLGWLPVIRHYGN